MWCEAVTVQEISEGRRAAPNERKQENRGIDGTACWCGLSVAALKSSFPWDDGTAVSVVLTHAAADVFRGI